MLIAEPDCLLSTDLGGSLRLPKLNQKAKKMLCGADMFLMVMIRNLAVALVLSRLSLWQPGQFEAIVVKQKITRFLS